MGAREELHNTLPEPAISFAELLASERMRLAGLCGHLTGNPGAAEDLAQETLLEAWRNQWKLSASELIDQARLAAWLSTIAHHVCARWRRRSGRDLAHLSYLTFSEEESEWSPDILPTDHDDLHLSLERAELTDLLERALALLPPATRVALVERYVNQSSHAEIAARLGLREDALVQRLHRGKQALRRILETDLRAEAAAYGLIALSPGQQEFFTQETRIWCPFCNAKRLVKHSRPGTNQVGFICPACGQLAWPEASAAWVEVRNPRSILNRQLAHLSTYYWEAINRGWIDCRVCGHQVQIIVFPTLHLKNFYGRNQSFPGIFMHCDHCQMEEKNPLPHLTIDIPEAQQFWRRHARISWQPESEIEYAGQPALLSGFQSADNSARLDVVYQRDTLKILGIHETTGS